MSDSENTIKLPESMTIKNVAEFKDDLIDASKDWQSVMLDAENVDEIDAAGIQILLALVKTLKEQDVAFEWLNPSVNILGKAISLSVCEALELE